MKLGNRSSDEWIAQYASSHQHPWNRMLHTFGIPIIALSLIAAPLSYWWREAGYAAAGGFLFGWVLQFAGHWFEGKPPEFFKDWRFLLVGLRWWFAKMAGRA